MYRAIRIQMIPQAGSNQAGDTEKCCSCNSYCCLDDGVYRRQIGDRNTCCKLQPKVSDPNSKIPNQ